MLFLLVLSVPKEKGEVVCKTEYKVDSAPAAKLPRIIDSNLFSIYKYIYRGVHTYIHTLQYCDFLK